MVKKPEKKADPKKKESSLGIEALLASALSDPNMKARLLEQLMQGGKK